MERYKGEKIMRKTLIAKKVSDGWYVEIKKTMTVRLEGAVSEIIRYEGLKKNKEFGNDRKIYAD